MSIRNPVSYDRPESLFTYKENLARLYVPYLYIPALSRRGYYTTFGKFSPPDWAAVGWREEREQLEKTKRKESRKPQLHRQTMRPMEGSRKADDWEDGDERRERGKGK